MPHLDLFKHTFMTIIDKFELSLTQMADTIVLYPSLGRGHLVSMVEFGQLILKHHPTSSFSIAIIIPHAPFEFPGSSIEDYVASISSSTSMISFHHLPTVPLPNNVSSPTNIPALMYQLTELNNPNLHQILLNLSKSSNLKAFVIDFFCNSSLKVSSSFNIPTYYYITTGASGLAVFLYFKTLNENTTKSLRDFNNSLIDFPGVPSIPVKDIPAVWLDRQSKVYWCFLDTAIQMRKCAGLILNTFKSLEERAVKAILDGHCTPGDPAPPVYCVGPVSGVDDNKGCRGEVEHECLNWLDSQPSRSVVFLCFGSMGEFCTRQLKEIANGLERSRVRFLWVVRVPPFDDETRQIVTDLNIESFLPEGFLDRTKDRGLVVKSWAPQIAVLNHGSVGGFVTHCGWNSILEAVSAGVPMLAWPLYAEQRMNRVFIVEEMKVALPVLESDEDGLVFATEMEKRVIELMNSEKGQAVRDRVMAMREGAVAATSDGGSSRLALSKLAQSFKHN